jgi:hypothetical protein
MSKLETNQVDPATGTTLTLGTSGDTVNLGAGVTAGTGFGKILQAVSATDTTERSTTSATFVTASNTLSVDITPSSTSSKIFVVLSTATYSSTANKAVYVTIYRDTSNLGNANGLIRYLDQGDTGGGAVTCALLDSPSTTSQVTYQAYIRVDSSSAGGNLNANSSGFITAFEVGA